MEFFREFEPPVHPQFAVSRLEIKRFSNLKQTLLHVAMAAYRTDASRTSNVNKAKGNNIVSLKFIESLIKNKFSMYLPDLNGTTALGYLLIDSVPAHAVFPVV